MHKTTGWLFVCCCLVCLLVGLSGLHWGCLPYIFFQLPCLRDAKLHTHKIIFLISCKQFGHYQKYLEIKLFSTSGGFHPSYISETYSPRQNWNTVSSLTFQLSETRFRMSTVAQRGTKHDNHDFEHGFGPFSLAKCVPSAVVTHFLFQCVCFNATKRTAASTQCPWPTDHKRIWCQDHVESMFITFK